MTKKKVFLAALSVVIAGFSPLNPLTQVLFAEEIVVSGNGAESVSTVSSSSDNNTSVSQSNDASISNNVDTNANTGNNSASDNNGAVAVQTGDVSTSTDITNQANASAIDSGCCPQQGVNSITVSGNGGDSTNTVNHTSTTTITTTQSQNATIRNNVLGTAVTGNNSANDNLGNVSIKTGDITVKENIKTGVNSSYVRTGQPTTEFTLKISGNGSDSTNSITLNADVTIENIVSNRANIINNSLWNLISGNNSANDNNGDVSIETGDIDVVISVKNEANTSTIIEDCCEKKPSETPSPTPTKPNPGPKEEKGGGGGGNGGGSGSGSGSSTPAGGSILPVTGGSWMMFLLIGNIIMLFFGTLLRLRSGRSPGFRYNFVI